MAETSASLEQNSANETLTYSESLAQIKTASEIVDRVAPADEAREYKQFLVDLTEHVAQAAGEGFMGSGEKVSQAELDYIATLKTTLGSSKI